jgi:hypothetical protein
MNATTTPSTPAVASDYFADPDINPGRDLSLLRPLITAAKAEISIDIAEGLVPETVGSFGELHDYVDANEYAQDDALDPDGGYAEWNYISDVLDRWLTVGRPDSRAQFALNRMAANGWEPVGLNGYVWVTLPAGAGDPGLKQLGGVMLAGVKVQTASVERKSPGMPWRRYSMPLSLVADFWAAWVSA